MGSKIGVQVLCEDLAKTVSHDEPYGLIGIVSPSNYHPEILAPAALKGYLPLCFHDDRCGSHPDPAVHEYWLSLCRTITTEQAGEIVDFVREMYDGGVRLFVIHCEAGVSRSSAVAKALWERFEKPTDWFDKVFEPNPLVYKALSAAFSS